MGVLPIGFFSPLPLAIMIPFMATQSLAMGEAFGKSFQYGKRKISSMTNEEFNKYTFSDMMTEQTANVKAYIPKLHEQMELSYNLQIDIFEEMVKIIPAFFEALLKSLQPLSKDFEDFNKTPLNQEIPSGNAGGGILVSANTPLDPTIISHEEQTNEDIPIIETSNYNQAIFRAMPLDELIKGINSGRFTGSDLSLAKHTLATRQETTDETLIPTVATAEQTAHQAWLFKLTVYLKQFQQNKEGMAKLTLANPSPSASIRRAISSTQNSQITLQSRIRAMSNDYRSSNNAIRRSALTLRQQIANGLIK